MSSAFDLEVQESRKRGSHLMVSSGDESVVLHSRYDPIAEAEGWAEELADEYDKIVLVGGGLGYLPRALEEYGVACAVLECLPVEDLPEGPPIRRLLDRNEVVKFEPGSEPVEIMDRLNAETVSGAKAVLHPGYRHLIPNVDSFLESLYLMSRGKLRNVQTRFRFMNRKFSNFLDVLPELQQIHPLTSLEGAYRHVPGVIAGSGPSLTDAYGWLRKFQDRLFIVAVDSAYSALRQAGIQPDVTIAMDPQQENAEYIAGVSPQGGLVTSLTGTPEYAEWARGQTRFGFFPSDDLPGRRLTSVFLRWFRPFISGESHLQSGGSIATTAVDFLRWVGADPICITGVDHAYPHFRAVASGTRREEQFLQSLNRFETLPGKHLNFIFENLESQGKELKRVTSREGHWIYTMDEYEVQNNWFEQAAGVLGAECLDMRSDGLAMSGWNVVQNPGDYLENRSLEPVDALSAKNLTTFQVDWEKLEKETESLVEQCPAGFDTFMRTVESKERPDNAFWEYFARPLLDYLTVKDPEDRESEVEDFYRALVNNIHSLRTIIRECR